MRRDRPFYEMFAIVAAIATPTASKASCFTDKQLRAQTPEYWARYVMDRADVVIEAEVVRAMTSGQPEVLRGIEIFKGPPEPIYTLALPETFSTSTLPATGISTGKRHIVALTMGPRGYYLEECQAAALTRDHLTSKLMRRNVDRRAFRRSHS